MKIALTADPELDVPPQLYGGIERIIDMLARGLSKRGHEVTLFARAGSTCPVELIPWPGKVSQSRVATFANAATLAHSVAVRRFDIVHSFSRIAFLTPILPFPIAKLMSYQREISPQTTSQANNLARGSLEFSAISRQMMEAAPLAGRWHLVPNGVPLDVYDFRGEVREDAPFVFLGRLEEIKGPHLAIDVARAAGRKLILAGNVPSEHRTWFEATVAPHVDGDRVVYVGPVDDAAKNALLGAAAAFLMPILWEEPFGIVMAEAMACGTPVLGLRRGAVPEVVAHGRTGYVVDSVVELVEAARHVGAIQRRACRDRVEALYSDDAVTSGYLAVYGEIVARVRRSSERGAAERMRSGGLQ